VDLTGKMKIFGQLIKDVVLEKNVTQPVSKQVVAPHLICLSLDQVGKKFSVSCMGIKMLHQHLLCLEDVSR